MLPAGVVHLYTSRAALRPAPVNRSSVAQQIGKRLVMAATILAPRLRRFAQSCNALRFEPENQPMIDLFSDTKTKPTAAMRQVMARAEVGDERANEDPSVNRLVERCAALLGKAAALYLPSGTMCNEIALAVHCRPGDEVICDATSHIIHAEGGGPAALAGVMLNPVVSARGVFSAAQLREKIRADEPAAARQRL